LGCPNRGDVSTGPATDRDQIEHMKFRKFLLLGYS
jgi:hypothetical protein